MRIALIGDYSETVIAHRAIPMALSLEAEASGQNVHFDWLGTADLADSGRLSEYDAGWAVPASPYASFDNALSTIRYLRESNKPFLGTCGGFQHALVEFARNVLGYREAGITEIDPDCPMPIVSALTCALIEQSEAVMPVLNGLIGTLAGDAPLEETYNCSFGLNPEFAGIFDGSGFEVAAHDKEGAVRAMALRPHPFFLGCAFQPERAALDGRRHPIITGFLKAAAGAAR